MIYLKYDLNKKIKGFYDTSSFNYNEDFSTTFIKITKELRDKIISGGGNIEFRCIPNDPTKVYDVTDYNSLFVEYTPDSNLIQKTPLQILQEENEELKKRQQVTQEALDYILMSAGGGV